MGKEVALGWISVFIQTVGSLEQFFLLFPSYLELKPSSTYASVVQHFTSPNCSLYWAIYAREFVNVRFTSESLYIVKPTLRTYPYQTANIVASSDTSKTQAVEEERGMLRC